MLEALSPLAARLSAWLEHHHRDPDAMGLALFIYGALLPGEAHAHVLEGAIRSPARARGRLWVLPQGYPVLVPDSAGPWIVGERVLGVSLERTIALTELDGATRGLYRRVWLMTEQDRGAAPAFTSAMSEPEARRLGCHPLDLLDWRTRRRSPVSRSPVT